MLKDCFYLQALHFFIGLGALISPLVADPFLTEDSCVLNTSWTPKYFSFHQNESDHKAERLEPISTYGVQTEGKGLSSVSYAFWIMALINVSSSEQTPQCSVHFIFDK